MPKAFRRKQIAPSILLHLLPTKKKLSPTRFPGGPWAHSRPTPGRFPRLAICQPEPGPGCGEHMRPQAGGRGGRKARAVRAEPPSYRSERDPAGGTDAAQAPKGLRGPTAANTPHRKAGEGLRGSEARADYRAAPPGKRACATNGPASGRAAQTCGTGA